MHYLRWCINHTSEPVESPYSILDLLQDSGMVMCVQEHFQFWDIYRMDSIFWFMYSFSLVPRPFPPPVFDHLQYTNTGGGNGLGMRLVFLDSDKFQTGDKHVIVRTCVLIVFTVNITVSLSGCWVRHEIVADRQFGWYILYVHCSCRNVSP